MNVGNEKNKVINKSIYITLIAIVSALYTVLVIINPFSWEIPQVRIADALFITVFFFGYPGIFGITLGCIVANIIGALGIIDIIFGSLANLVGGIIGYYLFKKIKSEPRTKKHLKIQLIILLMNVINTVIVGTYLPFLIEMPMLICYIGIFTGSLISMNGLGFLLYLALDKINIEQLFKI